MHIAKWLKEKRHNPTVMRSWLLERAFDYAHKLGAAVEPTVIEHLVTAELETAFQTVAETDFGGDEVAAWASLDRFAAGKSRRFLVTAYNGDDDGLAIAVADVPNRTAAFRKAATIIGEGMAYADAKTVDGEVHLAFPQNLDVAEMVDDYNESYEWPDRVYTLHAAPLRLDENLREAVCW